VRATVFRHLVMQEDASGRERLSALALMALIALNVLAVILESEPELYGAHGVWFEHFELFSVAVFGAEYLARAWTAPNCREAASSIRSGAACAIY